MLADPEVGRRQLRLLLRAGRTYVEDVAGGARLNGKAIRGTLELFPGDALSLGQTELAFGPTPTETLLEMPIVASSNDDLESTAILEVTAAPRKPAAPKPPPEETRLIELAPRPARAAVLARAPAVTRAPPSATGETRLLPSAPGLKRDAPIALHSDTGEISLALENELLPHVQTEEVLVPIVSREGEEITAPDGRPREVAISSMPTVELPSASGQSSPPDVGILQRSRARREAQESLGGLLKLSWLQMSDRARKSVIAGAILFGLATGVGLGLVFISPGDSKAVPLGPEPVELTNAPTEGSFGSGPGVDYPHADQKTFTFPVNAATRMAAVLHFHAEGLSEGELSISLNGVDQGFSPPDTASTRTREVTVVLPPSVVRRDGLNTVVFDSVRNPPASDPWKIWEVWIELLPVPDLPPQKLLELAREHARLAGEAWDTREVSSGNLFRAWKAYRNAWLSLEGLDAQTQSELYRHVRFQMGVLEAELDKTCSRLTLGFERSMTLSQRKKARQAIEEMERVFPSPEHRCHNLAREIRAQLEF